MSKKIFLVDTVGIIEGMTEGIMDAFEPTFAEIVSSDLILHVTDPLDNDWTTKKAYIEKLLIDNGSSPGKIIDLYSKKELLSIPVNRENSITYSAFNKQDIHKVKVLIHNFLFEKIPAISPQSCKCFCYNNCAGRSCKTCQKFTCFPSGCNIFAVVRVFSAINPCGNVFSVKKYP